MEAERAREAMVERISRAQTTPAALLDAMARVPRERFVETAPYGELPQRVDDSDVLAPATVAQLLAMAVPLPMDDARVLIVGAGVGYTAAVLAELVGAAAVHAVDIDRRLVRRARRNLHRAGYPAVLVDRADGTEGYPLYAPYDRIIVEAATARVPPALPAQLRPAGRLVVPLGAADQRLVSVDADGQLRDEGPEVSLAPLLAPGETPTGPVRNRTVREDSERAAAAAHRRHGWELDWIDWSRR
jgi:protein-L-isoaspartate(D-aspartate) O-methyltransferase